MSDPVSRFGPSGSPAALSLVWTNPAAQPALARHQKSFALRRQGRGASAGLADVLAANWSRFCMASFADVADCRDFFGVTGQCARNWMEGDVCRPASQHLLRAILAFGPDLVDLLADGSGAARVAA